MCQVVTHHCTRPCANWYHGAFCARAESLTADLRANTRTQWFLSLHREDNIPSPPAIRFWTAPTVMTAALICTTSMGHTVARSTFLCQLLSKLKQGSGGGHGPPLSRWIVQEASQFAFKDAKGLGCMFKSISDWLSYNIDCYIFPCCHVITAWLWDYCLETHSRNPLLYSWMCQLCNGDYGMVSGSRIFLVILPVMVLLYSYSCTRSWTFDKHPYNFKRSMIVPTCWLTVCADRHGFLECLSVTFTVVLLFLFDAW